MYLFEDVVKMRPQDFFDCQERSFSKICEKFNEEGLAVFKDIKEDETFKSESFSNKK